jgi:hypothetical protein
VRVIYKNTVFLVYEFLLLILFYTSKCFKILNMEKYYDCLEI